MRSFTGPVALLAALAFAAPAAAALDLTCDVRVGAVQRLADLPPGVRRAIPFPMVDPGRAFNVTDSVADPTLPFHRLICAWRDRDAWVVKYEFGGVYHNVARLRIPPAAKAPAPKPR